MLGSVIKTNQMTVSIPDHYIKTDLSLINSTLHKSCLCFTVKQAQELTGKLGPLSEGTTWVIHLLMHLYASIAHTLAKNKCLLMGSTHEFQRVVHYLRTGTFHCPAKDKDCHISYAFKRTAKMVHLAKKEINISKAMRQQIDFFHKKLCLDSGILWETPNVHFIPRMPTFTSFGDSCLEGAGGYSISLCFWWHLSFPEEIKQCTLHHKKDNTDGHLISINILELTATATCSH
jgi:hypothetical protein